MVKVFLHISKEDSGRGSRPGSTIPAKNWKFRRGDLDTRKPMGRVPGRYDDAITATSTDGRRGTSCRPTTNGCGTSRSPRCSSTCSRARPAIPGPRARTRGSRRRVGRLADWSRLVRAALHRRKMVNSMDVESRDSVSLKPAELDELGQLVSGMGLPLDDEQLDPHVEQFPSWRRAIDGEVQGSCSARSSASGAPRASSGASGVCGGAERPSQPRQPRRRAVPPGRHLVPRRGRARRGADRPPGRLLAASARSTTCARARSTRPTARSGRGAAAWPGVSAATPATTTAGSA